MPLEYPYGFNGLVMGDQSMRDLADPNPVVPRALKRAMAEPCIPCLEAKGFKGVRPRTAPSPTPPVYSGMVEADAYFPEFDLTVVAPYPHYNTGRSIGPGDLTGADGFDGMPTHLGDFQQAASYAAAVDTTIGMTAAQLGLTVGKQYRVMYTYRLNGGLTSAHTPRVGYHTTNSTDVAPVINTTYDLTAEDWNGLHDSIAGGGYHTIFTDALDEIFFRFFHINAAPSGAYLSVAQIYFFGNVSGKQRQDFLAGSFTVGTATSATDDTGSGWNAGSAVCEDSQITDTPNPSEELLQEYWSWETCVNAGETWIDRRQVLIAARTTDTTFLAEEGHLAIDVDGGPLDGIVNLTKGWAFWLIPVLLDPEIDDGGSPTAEPDSNLYMYAPSTAPGGTLIHTDFISFVKPPLVTPEIAETSLPGCDTFQGAGQADIDGLVYWNFQVNYPWLADVILEFIIPEWGGDWNDPGSISQMYSLDGGLFDTGTDLAFDAVLDAGTYTIEIRATYNTSAQNNHTAIGDDYAPSGVVSCQFTVGEGDPPYPVTITNCPTGPIFVNTQTVEFEAPAVDGFSVPDHYTYRLDGGAPVTVASSPFTLVGLAPGTHTVCIESWDAAGNHSPEDCCTFVVDEVNPPTGGGIVTRDLCGISDLDWGALNGPGWWVKVISVDGLWDADVRDERYPRPGRSGERSFDDFYGGKSITVTAQVRARNLARLREGQRAVQSAFSDLQSHRFYFRSWIDAQLLYVCARKIQPVAMPEEQADENYRRQFVVMLRGDDPRAYSVTQKCVDLTLGDAGSGGSGTGHWRTYPIQTAVVAGGNPLRMRSYNIPGDPNLRDYPGTGLIGGTGGQVTTQAVNDGTAESYPVTQIYGPISGPLVLANVTTGEQITWDADLVIQSGQFLQVDHAFGEIMRNGVQPLDFTGLDATNTEFWPLEPGINEIALLAFQSGTGAHATICWRDAYR